MSTEEWDPETGLRVVRERKVLAQVGPDDRWRPPPWHPERRDGPDPDGFSDAGVRGPLPPTLSGGAAAALPESDEP